MICVNFVWGILIFREPVADIGGTFGAFACLGLGLVGMAKHSAPQKHQNQETDEDAAESQNDPSQPLSPNAETTSRISLLPHYSLPRIEVYQREEDRIEEHQQQRRSQTEVSSDFVNFSDDEDTQPQQQQRDCIVREEEQEKTVVLLGYKVGKRFAGIHGAVFNGIMAGSSLIPIHYAKRNGFGGANYMISFATGALIANSCLWVVFFAYECIRQRTQLSSPASSVGNDTEDGPTRSPTLLEKSLKNMPRFHVRKLLLPGFVSGLLLSIAMFGSILSVTYLGQAVGNSVVQAKILVRYVASYFCGNVSRIFALSIPQNQHVLLMK